MSILNEKFQHLNFHFPKLQVTLFSGSEGALEDENCQNHIGNVSACSSGVN